MRHNGFSIVEMLIVIAIAGILAGLAIAGFTGFSKKYNVDNETREIYSDLMNVRIMAMNKNRTHFVTLSANSYTAYDDTDPAPNGDGTLTVGSDAVALSQKTLSAPKYLPITWSGSAQLEFNSRGLSTTPNTLCIYSNVQPFYDCVKVSSTRIIIGKLIAQGVCSADNCQSK